MTFVSTRNPAFQVSLGDAVFQGLAPDGGLFMPREEGDLRTFFSRLKADASFPEVAAGMLHGLFPEDFSPARAETLAQEAFPFAPVLRDLGPSLAVLELFHGPSCAFKDFGASFLAVLMQDYLRTRGQRAVILTATSGDTGSAVAQAFYRKENIDVVILYPKGRVSPSQEQQLTTLGGNIHALEVAGSFDDCQRMVKEAFLDPALRTRFPLTSANSINLGRLLPQSFYYAWAFSRFKGRKLPGELYFTVPSGNFGNLTAGVMAWSWGLPVQGFLAATNRNDVVPEYLIRGRYEPRPSVATLSNAMDVGNPSNFERLQALFHMDIEGMRALIQGSVVDDPTTREVMARYQRDQGYFLCPHSAVGVRASERFIEEDLGETGLVISLATAHPGKFSEVVVEACGVNPPIPDRLAEFMKRTKQATDIGPSLAELASWLDRHIKK